MGTIVERRLKDGTIVYTAQLRIMRDGKKTSTSSSFERRASAEAWLQRKEFEARKPGGFEKLQRSKSTGHTLADAIERFAQTSERTVGRTKAQVLRAILAYDIATMACDEIASSDIVRLAQQLRQGGRQPQTVQNYLSHLSAIFQVAGPAWGMPLRRDEMASAIIVCNRLGLTSKSKRRERRPTIAEMDTLLAHFEARHMKRNALPMHLICMFALFSGRRQEEITTIRWADLEDGRILVRDMKHPGEKIGNNQWVDIPPEAERIVRAMPRTSERIFPYKPTAITAAFTRACHIWGIEDLHFHDLRHEAVSRLFEMGKTIPQVASVSGHRSWQSLQRYSHIRSTGDRWLDWAWTQKQISLLLRP